MRLLAAIGLLCALAGGAAGQRMAPPFRPAAVPGPAPTGPGAERVEVPGAPILGMRIPAWSAPIASAILPGAGQAVLGQQRSVAYLALEAFVWLQYFKDQRDWRQQRAAYRDLAATVARSPFTANPPLGDWAYYESMEHYLESGVYSVSGSAADVQPETNEGTYNGAMWLLARTNYWPNPAVAPPVSSPEYQSALRFYESRAVRPEYRWSWRNAQLEQDLYRRTINKANDAVRRATSDLGIVLANHVLSMVDAFSTWRLAASRGPGSDYRVGWTVPLP
ncbi:MAG: hypothetical protein KGL38_10640 [Gemmatimonadota bacterium]|nr:hypothetical protein [Gemmatimonadota bacterium]MDE3173998.1 hypothetical protein [Gemmatimonadota bacterium]